MKSIILFFSIIGYIFSIDATIDIIKKTDSNIKIAVDIFASTNKKFKKIFKKW